MKTERCRFAFFLLICASIPLTVRAQTVDIPALNLRAIIKSALGTPLGNPIADVKLWLTRAQQLDLTEATSLRGIGFLEQLLTVLVPKETALLPNYPNPFNPETWIPYRLAEDAFVTLTIYDAAGGLSVHLTLDTKLRPPMRADRKPSTGMVVTKSVNR